MIVTVSHAECDARYEQCQRALMKALELLRDVTHDRDEWKEQHENLLAIYHASLTARDKPEVT